MSLANPNSKQSKDSLLYDNFIQTHWYKSSDTKRRRVSYFCGYKNCNKEFRKRWNLVDHIKTHIQLFPYKWELWSSWFVQKGNLLRHQRTHMLPNVEDRKIFDCPYCKKSYTENYNLINHLKKSHKNVEKKTPFSEPFLKP